MLSQELTKLYNTLALIETKGENTKIMTQCMVFLEQLTSQIKDLENKKEEKCEKEDEKK